MGNVKSCCVKHCGCCGCCCCKPKKRSENIGLHPMARALVDERRSLSDDEGIDEVGMSIFGCGITAIIL